MHRRYILVSVGVGYVIPERPVYQGLMVTRVATAIGGGYTHHLSTIVHPQFIYYYFTCPSMEALLFCLVAIHGCISIYREPAWALT